MNGNLASVVEALQRAGRLDLSGKVTRSGVTVRPLDKRRADRRKKNKAAKKARKRNR